MTQEQALAEIAAAQRENRRANLYGANLSDANLTGAALTDADLRGADLTDADLTDADLRGADLTDANLTDADLTCAKLTNANLTDATLGPRSIVPETGSFTGWKKLQGGVIAQLRISAKAERVSSLVGRKCRASKVRVVALFNRDGSPCTVPTAGLHRTTFFYAPSAVVMPDAFDPDPRVECTHGIHFFITRKEAEDY